MKRLWLLVTLTSIAFTGIAQEQFPDSWVGNYSGELEIYAVDSVRMKLNMKLKIQPSVKDSIYSWTIVYDLKDGVDVRAYELRVINKEKGHYQIDEKNSIVIDSYFKKNIFTSFFQVMDSFIIATYTFNTDDEIVFEIIASKTKEVSASGGGKWNDEEIPRVLSYEVNGRQRAVLIKDK